MEFKKWTRIDMSVRFEDNISDRLLERLKSRLAVRYIGHCKMMCLDVRGLSHWVQIGGFNFSKR